MKKRKFMSGLSIQEKEAEKYHELGLSSITTNCPGRIKKHLSNSI